MFFLSRGRVIILLGFLLNVTVFLGSFVFFTYFEKILEAFFIKFENLDKYKKALIFLSSKKRDKFLNFLILNNQNHKFILKLMKCCGDKDPYFKLNIKATLLNSLYIKNLNVLLNRKEITIDKIMSNLDKDLKKVFELPFLFKN